MSRTSSREACEKFEVREEFAFAFATIKKFAKFGKFANKVTFRGENKYEIDRRKFSLFIVCLLRHGRAKK